MLIGLATSVRFSQIGIGTFVSVGFGLLMVLAGCKDEEGFCLRVGVVKMSKVDIDITERNWVPTPLAGPIVLVTTVDVAGNVNIAPKSWVALVSADPNLIVLGCDRRHHTAQNLLANGECVLNFPSDNIALKTWQTHKYLEPCADEPNARGFTTVSSNKVRPPRLVECRAHIECRLESAKFYGDSCVLTLEVIAVSVDEKALEYKDPYGYLRPIFYLEPGTYGVIERSNSLKAGVGNGIEEGQDHTLFVILLSKTSSERLPESLIRAHVQFLRKLDRDNKLVLCGPFADYEGGMIVIRASSLEEANSIAMSDPFVAHEVENYEIRTWQLSCEANNHMGMG